MNEYSSIAKGLHWLIAILVLGLVAVGLYMTSQRLSPKLIELYKLHKSTGLMVLALMVLRLLWRIGHQPPVLPATIPAWQRIASGLTHGMLYLCLFVMPISGWLMNSATGTPMRWFGLFPVPSLLARDAELLSLWKNVHFYSAWLLIALIGLHVAAALKHHFIDRDRVLQRMLPNHRTKGTP